MALDSAATLYVQPSTSTLLRRRPRRRCSRSSSSHRPSLDTNLSHQSINRSGQSSHPPEVASLPARSPSGSTYQAYSRYYINNEDNKLCPPRIPPHICNPASRPHTYMYTCMYKIRVAHPIPPSFLRPAFLHSVPAPSPLQLRSDPAFAAVSGGDMG